MSASCSVKQEEYCSAGATTRSEMMFSTSRSAIVCHCNVSMCTFVQVRQVRDSAKKREIGCSPRRSPQVCHCNVSICIFFFCAGKARKLRTWRCDDAVRDDVVHTLQRHSIRVPQVCYCNGRWPRPQQPPSASVFVLLY